MLAKHQQLSFDQIIGWEDENHLEVLSVFLQCRASLISNSYPTRNLNIEANSLKAIAEAIPMTENGDIFLSPQSAKSFFEEHFCPVKFDGKDQGFFTGYYQPIVKGALQKTSEFGYPLYRKPDDLIKIDHQTRPKGWSEDIRFARLRDGQIEMHHNREEVDKGALANQGLEIVWVKDAIEALFIHIQGSALIELEDGQHMPVHFSAKSGHEYTAIGKTLIKRGYMKAEDLTAESLKLWLYNHPDKQNNILWTNQSYIYFETYSVDLPSEERLIGSGPIGAANVPLMPYRSIAIDRTLHTFSTPIWVDVDLDFVPIAAPFRRLMIAQDTGSAIIGPRRGDLFIGVGDQAGQIAGQIKHSGRWITLVPRALLEEN